MFQEVLYQFVTTVSGYLWNYLIIFLLVLIGFWFTFRMKFMQIRHIPEMVRLLGEGVGVKTEGNHISSFQAFCVSAASRVGVGNIAGIAIAVVLGGPGAVFWMWFIAVIGAATGYVESTLGQVYKVPAPLHGFHGGPAYYIKYGLRSPWLGAFFAVLISITYGLIYNSVQANTIAASLGTFSINPLYSGIVFAILSGIVIFGGVARIARVSEKIVPIMAIVYILTAVYVVLVNINLLPNVFYHIFTDAFSFNSAAGGLFGATIMNGIKRGLFSNEAGEGSVPNAAATADVSHPAKQGLIQALGVFVDTMFICTASAFIVLFTGNYASTGLNGIALVQYDLGLQLGSWAPPIMAFFIMTFAFSSIVGNYYYGEININHLTRKKVYLHIFRLFVVLMVFLGSIATLDLVWALADLFMGFLVLTNITSIVRLGKVARIVLEDYFKQKKAGIKEPVFTKDILPDQHGIAWWTEKDVAKYRTMKDQEANWG
ncbi:MAG: alanine/glycine:cation symporter family protein [Veillonellaceae bacterium]|nr:alanine/glycine:cation symporter family protein [Veillonellaceae bacterium]